MNIPSRIYAQYRNKPKSVAWYAITRRLAEQIDSVSQAVRVMYNIDNATGEQLDIIGRIVVVDRSFVGSARLFPGLFAFTDGDQFGDDQAMFSGLTVDTDEQMSDDFYRLVIKAKIIKNNSDATADSILSGLNFLIPNADFIRLTDGEDMSFNVEFYGNITVLERYALLNATLVPKPQGVLFNGFLEGFEYSEFGDDTMEFGDVTSEFVGYTGV